MAIHATATIDKSSEISSSAVIDAYAYIGKNCKIGDNVYVGRNAHIDMNTEIGDGTRIFSHAHLGAEPQDYSYRGEDTKLIIGKNCVIRENAPIHRATAKDKWETVIRDNVFIMALSHIGHDCIIEDNVTIVSGVLVGGHSVLECNVTVGGGCEIHQFTRIGRYSMIGGGSSLRSDVPPFVLIAGNPTILQGLNAVGLKRACIKPDVRLELKRAYKIYTKKSYSLAQVLKELESLVQFEEIKYFSQFLLDSKRPLLRD